MLPRGYIHVYDHIIQTSSSLKLLGQSKPNFMWSILRKGKVCINGQGHMTKMAAMAINRKKTFKNLLQWADFHETWYVASGTRAHHSLYKS